MTPVVLWIRRGTASWLTLLTLLVPTGMLVDNRSWQDDADWGARLCGSMLSTLLPVVAAGVAFDMAGRFRPSLAQVATSARRGRLGASLPGLAVVLTQAVVAALLVLCVVLWVSHTGGLTWVDGWLLPELVAATCAAVAVGAAVGSVARPLVGGAVAGAVVLAAPMIIGLALPDAARLLFSSAVSNGTMLGLERVPSNAAAAIGLHLLVTVAGGLVVRRSISPRPVRASVLGGALIGVLTAAVVAVQLSSPETGSFRPSHDPQACWGEAPTVCGPDRGAAVLVPAQADLAQATHHLRGSGLQLPDTYVFARMGTNGYSATTTQLTMNLEDRTNGHLDRRTILEALSTPRACAGYFTDQDFAETQVRTTRVSSWIDGALDAPHPGPAPAAVRSDYEWLLQCRTVTR